MIKLGLLGAGMMGNVHAEMLTKIPGVEVIAISKIKEQQLERIQKHLPEIKYYKNEEEFFSAGIKVVDITLPTFLHKEYIEKALLHGLDVICEKPLCLTLQEADEILNLNEKVDNNVYIAHVIRFWPEYIYLKKCLESGRLGRLRSMYMGRYTGLPDWSVDDWIVNRQLSGATPLDLQIHDVDFVLYALGMPDDVQCKVLENRLHIWTQYFYEPDTIVMMEAGNDLPAAFGFEMNYRAVFEDGMLLFNSSGDHGLIEITDQSRKINLSEQSEAQLERHLPSGNGYLTELAHFIDCIRKKIPSEYISVKSAAHTVQMILKYLS